MARLAAAVTAGGVVVSYGVLGGDIIASVSTLDVMFKDLAYRAFYLDGPEYGNSVPAILAETAALIASGKLRVPVAAVYPVEELSRAIEHARQGGKVLLRLVP